LNIEIASIAAVSAFKIRLKSFTGLTWLKLFINKTNDGWKVYDFGFWDFRYTKMKRGLYLGYIRKNDIEGLINHLNNKNYRFFKKIFF